MNCPLCGSKVTYQGLNTLECAGSAMAIHIRTGVIAAENCPNYRPAPVVEGTALDFEPLSFGVPFLFTAAPGLSVGSRAWAVAMFAAGRTLEWRYVNGVTGFRGPWSPPGNHPAHHPAHSHYDDYPPYTIEWRLKP